MIGLGETETAVDNTDIDRQLLFDAVRADVRVMHNNTLQHVFDYEPVATFTFYVHDEVVECQVNGTTFYSESFTPSSNTYVDTSFFKASSGSYAGQADYTLSNFTVESAFATSTPVEDLHISENATDGATVGFVVPSDPDSPQDIVIDGLLTEGLPAGSTQVFGTGATFGAWEVESGAVESLGGWHGPGPLGGVPLELSAGTPGTIVQTLNTEVGQTYQITFALSGDWSAGSSVKEMRASAGGESQDFQIEQPDNWTAADPVWEHRTLTFTATDTTTDLRFSSLDFSSAVQASVIADVQVIEIPQAVSTILNNDPTLSYDAATGKFYRLVTAEVDWDAALAGATSDTLNGVAGQLVTIQSAYENELVRSAAAPHYGRVWLGASDQVSEGDFYWYEGNQEGERFWTGGSAENGAYTNFNGANPDNGGGTQHYIRLYTDTGLWDDNSATAIGNYIVEWDASEVLSNFTFSLTDDAGGRFRDRRQHRRDHGRRWLPNRLRTADFIRRRRSSHGCNRQQLHRNDVHRSR